MLYRFIKFLAIVAVRTFFNRITIRHRSRLPNSGPVIFVANHPNTMIDPMVIGYAVNRDLTYLAKSTIFKRPLNHWILSKLRLVPVFRKMDNPNETAKNERTFEKCYHILEKGDAFLIFPEGVSTGEQTINKIKTGAARIGFGAEQRNDFSLGVQIVPVGISYSDITKFRSDVTIRFGRPIELREYFDLYKKDEVRAVKEVTQHIDEALHKLTLTLEYLEIESIVEAIKKIYRQELAVELGKVKGRGVSDFSINKGLINAVEWFYRRYPEKVERFKSDLDHYLRNLNRLHVKDEFLQPQGNSSPLAHRIRMILILLAGFPLFIFGLINNYIPHKIPRWYTQTKGVEKSMFATTKMVIGIGSFLLYYALILSLVFLLSGSWVITVIYALLMPPSGNFVLRYVHWVDAYRQHLTFLSIFYQKKQLLYRLIADRNRLISDLNQFKEEYFAESGFIPGTSA
ncbi:MAG: hypothetical protein GXO90_05420 [FCB group bacterium]|nr:hypothetical protein [FCB group bacterium]